MAVSVILVCGGLFIGAREIARAVVQRKDNEPRKRRVGRYTASILLIAISVPLFLDWREGTDYMLLLLKWW